MPLFNGKIKASIVEGKVTLVGENNWVNFTSSFINELNECGEWSDIYDVIDAHFKGDGSSSLVLTFIEDECMDLNVLLNNLSDAKWVNRLIAIFIEFVD